MVAPAVIAAGLQVVGGIFGRRSENKAIAAQNAYNAPIKVRERAEAAGFNPLLFVGPGVGQQTTTGGTNYMGSAIANAGLALADGMDKKAMLDVEKSRLAMDRQKLDVLIQNATIRPRSGGIYTGNVRAPSAGGVGKPASSFLALPIGPRPKLAFSTSKTLPVPAESAVTEYGTTSGTSVLVPRGPDIDEVISGFAIETFGRWKAAAQVAQENKGKPVEPMFTIDLNGDRPITEKYDLGSWPFYGWSPFNPNYKVK